MLRPAGVEGQPQTAKRLPTASHCLPPRLPAHHVACRHRPWPDSPSWLEEDVCTWHPQPAEGSPGQAATGDTLLSSVPVRPRVGDQPPIPFPKLVRSMGTGHRSLVHALWWLPAFCQETRAPGATHRAVWLNLGPLTGRRAVLGQVRRAGPGRRQQTGLRGPRPTCPRRCVGHPPTPPPRSPACAEATSAPGGWGWASSPAWAGSTCW